MICDDQTWKQREAELMAKIEKLNTELENVQESEFYCLRAIDHYQELRDEADKLADCLLTEIEGAKKVADDYSVIAETSTRLTLKIEQQNKVLKEDNAKLRIAYETLERERDFYLKLSARWMQKSQIETGEGIDLGFNRYLEMAKELMAADLKKGKP